MQIAEEIDLYIQRISKDYGLSITLHPCGNEQLISKSNLIKYNIHSPGYCLYLKSNPNIFCNSFYDFYLIFISTA